MEATARLIAWLQRVAPACGMAAGVPFFALWQARADGAEPSAVATAVHLLTWALLTVALLGHQLAQGTQPLAWLGWAGVGSAIQGFLTSPFMLCVGLVLFGVSVVRCGVHRPATGHLMSAGSGLLLLTLLVVPPAGAGGLGPLVHGYLVAAGLLAVAGALLDLGLAALSRSHGAPA